MQAGNVEIKIRGIRCLRKEKFVHNAAGKFRRRSLVLE